MRRQGGPVADIERPIRTLQTNLGGFSDDVIFEIPTLNVQSANTTVRVPDGGSVILGGLRRVSHVNRQASIPWFAQIPLFGILLFHPFPHFGPVNEVVETPVTV